MATSVNTPETQSHYPSIDPTSSLPLDERKLEPLEQLHGTTSPVDPDLISDTENTSEQEPKKFVPPRAMSRVATSADSTPIQIWEGIVIEVDHAVDVMRVDLNAKIVQMPRHTGEIDLEWVSEQDQDLIRPGAVFYLTLYKRTKRGSIENTQELRFRRRPSWSTTQLKQIDEEAVMLLSKMRPLPTSE